MTFAQMQTRVFRRLQEASSSPVYWTRAQIQAALAEGYAEISDATEWHERRQTVTLLAEHRYYDVRTVLGRDVLSVREAALGDPVRWLPVVSHRDLDGHDRRWEARVGLPTHVVSRSLFWVAYWPVHAAGGQTVTQYVTALPAALAGDDEPGFPEEYHEGVVDYALADLWAQDAESTLSATAWAQYLAHEAGLTAWVTSRASLPMMHQYGGR